MYTFVQVSNVQAVVLEDNNDFIFIAQLHTVIVGVIEQAVKAVANTLRSVYL